MPALVRDVPSGTAKYTVDADATGYSLIEGIAHQNEFVRGRERVIQEPGNHALSDELRLLGLETATPVLSARSEHMRGSFGQSFQLR